MLVAVLGGSASYQPSSASNILPMPIQSIADNSALRILDENAEGLILEFTPAAPIFENLRLAGQDCQEVSIPGQAQLEQPGFPDLPVQGAMLGIPQGAQPTIRVRETEQKSLPSSYALCPAPQPDFSIQPHQPAQLQGIETPRSPAYQQDAFLPAKIVELVSTGNLRSQRIAQIRLNPLQYNPVSGSVRYYSRIQFEVKFYSHAGQAESFFDTVGYAESLSDTVGQAERLHTGQANSLSYIDEGIFESHLESLLLNYEQARLWRSRPAPVSLSVAASLPEQVYYKIAVDQDGIYQLSYADLAAAGLPVDSIDPRTFQLFNQSLEVAMHVEGQANGVFEPGEYLLFYGQKVDTKFTDTNVYWLTWGGLEGRRMEPLDSEPTGSASVPVDFLTSRHLEQDDSGYYRDEPSGTDNDHWYWWLVYADSAPVSQDFKTNLEHLNPGSGMVSVHGLLKGYATSSTHHTRLYLNPDLNSNPIDDHVFAFGSEYNFSISNIPSSYLQEGENTLRVEIPRDGGRTLDGVLVNWFEIDYYDTYYAEDDRLFFDGEQAGNWEFQVDGFSLAEIEAFDITDPLAPMLVTGATVTPTTNGFRLDFEQTISGERRYLGQTTDLRLSALSIILDSPSSWKTGTFGADYILISHADFIDQVQPLADFRSSQGYRVQLVDVQDIYDEFNGGVSSPEAIKTFLEFAYANWDPAPSFVLLVGDGNFDFKNVYGWDEPNFIPPYLDDVDPWIGETATDNRYASVSGNDILPDLYIGRFPARTPAEAQVMVQKTLDYERFPAQGGWNARQLFVADNPDPSGDYPTEAELIINSYVPEAYTVDRLYYNSSSYTPASARFALQAAVNQGSLLVHYNGHGTTQQWASEGFLRVLDLPTLTNGSKLPFFLPMTCAEGYFVWPSPSESNNSGLGESLVRHSNGGAIASWSPGGYGLSAGHALLDESLFDHIFNQHHNQLGYLTTQAKYEMAAITSSYNDLVETYILFGDPALRLQTLSPVQVFLPVVDR